MRVLLFLGIIFSGSLFAGSVNMINDTSFPLNAIVFAADGSKKGTITIPPQGSATWQDTSGGNYTWSQTPYRVTLICTKTGKQYGVIDGVQQAATIRASMATGNRDCTPDKKDQNNQQAQHHSQQNNQQSGQQQMQQQGGDPDWGPPEGSLNPSGASTGTKSNESSASSSQGSSSQSSGDPIWGPP